MSWEQEFIAVIGIVLGRNVSWQDEAVLCVCMFSQAEESATGAAGGLRVIWKVEKQLFTRECYWNHTCYKNFLYEVLFNESCSFDPCAKGNFTAYYLDKEIECVFCYLYYADQNKNQHWIVH